MDIENLSPLPDGPLAFDAQDREPILRRDRQLFAGGIIAEFTSGRDAVTFASLKRESGEEVEITPGINHPFAVRRMVRVS